MKNNFQNEQGSALIIVLLAIVVVTILFTTLMWIQVSEMKGQQKFEENFKEIHEFVGDIDEAAFHVIKYIIEQNENGVSLEDVEICDEVEKTNSFKDHVSCVKGTNEVTVSTTESHIKHKWVFSFY